MQFDGTFLNDEVPLTEQERNVLAEVYEYIRTNHPELMFESKEINRGLVLYILPVKKASSVTIGTGV